MLRASRIVLWGLCPSLMAALLLCAAQSSAQDDKDKKEGPEFRPHADVLKDFKRVTAPNDEKSLYTIWVREKDSQMFAELPSSFASDRYFIALTIASGERYAGLQSGDLYVYWRRYDKRLALIAPNVGVRSTGDDESKASVKRLFTDRVLLDVPIETIGPGGGPVIDMDQLLIEQSHLLLGRPIIDQRLKRVYSIKSAKAFPNNVELAFEVPTVPDPLDRFDPQRQVKVEPPQSGRLQTLHYSISRIDASPGYKPRLADQRVGYFSTVYVDLGKISDEETRIRYINRWHLEKRESKLKLSPPKKPITFYIEHTTPVLYRRWVREGILSWNKAFEKVGLADAIEVVYQDPKAGADGYMDKDPEDVRWNFVRWLNNDEGTAIGPSRVDPTTGEILDADIILTDGWIRYYNKMFSDVVPQTAIEGMNPQTLAWLAQHPDWDPRILNAEPAQRPAVRAFLQRQARLPYSGHPLGQVDASFIGDNEYDGLLGRTSQINGLCLAAQGMAFDVALMRMHLAVADGADDALTDAAGDDKDKKDEPKKDEPKKEEKNLIDDMPEEFVGPLLAHLVAHEVGHTLGLRHNFKGSSQFTLAEINSDKVKGKQPLAASVMDYTPVNINLKGGEIQGDYAMTGIGPYDMWAIEYGYSFDDDLKPILARVAEPELQYATDEDTIGPDPLARRYDFSKNPLDYAQEQMRLAAYHRERLIEKFVKDGQSWDRARRGYELTLRLQDRVVATMANWVGGAFVYRDKKGDKNARPPINVVPVQQQRDALKFVIDNTFRDEAFGLTPEIVNHMTVDKWYDDEGMRTVFLDPTWPVHDKIMAFQGTILTQLMNPTMLERVYDNEFRVPSQDDSVTLPELLTTLRGAIWSELDKRPEGQFTARRPMVSSLRRNLQLEHVKRLIDLSLPGQSFAVALKPISELATVELREIRGKIDQILTQDADKLDPYTKAHLGETKERITKALDAQYIYNAKDIGGGARTLIQVIGQPEQQVPTE